MPLTRSRAALVSFTLACGVAMPGEAGIDSTVAVKAMDGEIRGFLRRELAVHLAAAGALDRPSERVLGALTTGEYTWGTFMRSLAAYAQLTGESTLADRDLPRAIGRIGLIEVQLGGTRFSQLYAALSLRHYGTDLSSNALWQALAPVERERWRTLLDATRFYDPAKRQVINLPENYLGVAARIAAIAWELELLPDRTLLDSLLDRAAVQFTSGSLYADDALPAGRFDRYSNEYTRYVWEAAQIAGREDLLKALRPSLTAQMRLWWDLVGEDGYGYPWGRSLGVVSYLDTLEIVGFLAIAPEFRPAPFEQLAAAYGRAWRWLQRDYNGTRHLLSLFDFGRGNYGYITPDREWQQTVGFFGKLAQAHIQFMAGAKAASLGEFPAAAAFPRAARFEFFRQQPRQAGVWVIRDGHVHFAVPFTTGTKPGVADYLPAPHGLAGFAAPVEQVVPSLVPFLELEDGTRIVAADGADAIAPSDDRRSVKARWTRWARIGAKPGEFVEPGLSAEVEWRVDGQSITRTEQLTATRPLSVTRWTVIVPTTADRWERTTASGVAVDTFSGPEGRLTVAVRRSDWPVHSAVRATGDSAAGRGARGAIPLHLEYEATNLMLRPGISQGWQLQLTVN
jgi:hypothetical protein